MRFSQSPWVRVRRTKAKGWGVYARKFIPCDVTIEEVPVLLIPAHDLWRPDGTSALADYVYVWDDTRVAIALGYGSLYNHSYTPNARYVDDDPCLKRYIALRDIERKEEITINYNATPDDRTDVGFDVL
jgi:SET domain-containing protein